MQPEWQLPLSPDGIVMELADDRGRMRVRPIRISDADDLIAGYDKLSHESKYFRFFTARPRMSRAMAEQLTDVDHVNHFAWVVSDADADEANVGVAAARLIRDDDDPTSAEAAITVVDDYHHRGIGRFLIELLVCTAAEVGVDTLRFEVLRENHKMKRLMGSIGTTAQAVPGDPSVIAFLLPVPPAEELAVPAGSIYRLLHHMAAGPAPVDDGDLEPLAPDN